MVNAGSGQNQGLYLGLPRGWQRPNSTGPSSNAFPRSSAGSWTESRVAGTQPASAGDASITGNCFSYCAITPAPFLEHVQRKFGNQILFNYNKKQNRIFFHGDVGMEEVIKAAASRWQKA